jgi:hypothetical protein
VGFYQRANKVKEAAESADKGKCLLLCQFRATVCTNTRAHQIKLQGNEDVFKNLKIESASR